MGNSGVAHIVGLINGKVGNVDTMVEEVADLPGTSSKVEPRVRRVMSYLLELLPRPKRKTSPA